MKQSLRFLIAALGVWPMAAAHADIQNTTPNLYGMAGLNTIPSARMDKSGTIRASLAMSDPYFHTSLGFQINNSLYMGLRQTSEISDLLDDPDKVYPGLDLKLKLFDEKKYRPEIAIGMQSAFGHKRMAGEYIAFSKRHENFDFTAGFGWGRFGTGNTVPFNPLDWTGSYLDKNRQLDGDKPNAPKDWFTGDTGFFAGVEYATPMKGLNLKVDWSSDAYKAEHALDMKSPTAFSFGLSYQPADWVDMGVALIDKDTVMARLSLKSMIKSWPYSPSDQSAHVALAPDTKDWNIVAEGKRQNIQIRNIFPGKDSMSGQIYLEPYKSSPYQLSQAWRIITNKTAVADPDTLRLEPIYFGLKAPAITINKHDLIEAAEKHNGSAEEIWRHTEFDERLSDKIKKLDLRRLSFKLRETFSISEDDAPFIHRTDFIGTLTHQFLTYFLSETSLRYNLLSNFEQLDEVRIPMEDPVRSDESYFVERKFAIEHAFLQGFKSFTTDWHISASAGYLDEMFAGYHGEILYRPWGRNWAAGFEIADVIKRDYDTSLNMGFVDSSRYTGHVNFYYEFPNTDTTLHASLGQYLGQDRGGSLEVLNRFENGSTVEAFITATDMHDPDPYGGSSNLSSGLRFTLPLGSLRYIPDGSNIEVNAEPVARDAGQKLHIAHTLYDMTEPLSYRHLTQRWMDITR